MIPSIRMRLLELWNLDLYRLPPDTQHRLRRMVKVTMLPLALLFVCAMLFTPFLPMFPHPDASGRVATGFVLFSTTVAGSAPQVSYGSDSAVYWLILVVNTYLLGVGGEVLLSLLDIWVYQRTTRQEYPWEDVIVYKLGSALVIASGALVLYPNLGEALVALLRNLFASLSSVGRTWGLGLRLPFVLLVTFALLLDDLFFYVGHRLSHRVRLMWKLGHVNHHRTQRLNRLTASPDFQLFFLNGSRGSFVTQVIGRAFFFAVLGHVTPEQAVGGATLTTVIRFLSASTAHSLSCYVLFARHRWLALLEHVLVIGRVHYVHHSSLPQHDVAHGCNFAATFSFWDKLFGTFVPAPVEVPPTGLFHERETVGNPWKFAFVEWVTMFLELKRNPPRHWGMILFGPAEYEPPVAGTLHRDLPKAQRPTIDSCTPTC